jgi:regulator-associated protein of mTOR
MTDVGVAGAGSVMSWEQRTQSVVVTGDVRIIRIWDAESELNVQDIPTGAVCCVTIISTDISGTVMFQSDVLSTIFLSRFYSVS